MFVAKKIVTPNSENHCDSNAWNHDGVEFKNYTQRTTHPTITYLKLASDYHKFRYIILKIMTLMLNNYINYHKYTHTIILI